MGTAIIITNDKNEELKVIQSPTNVQVIDSYKICAKKDITDWIDMIRKHCTFSYKRTEKSWGEEWMAHNLLYNWGVKRDRTKDVDLDEGETKFRQFLYSILAKIYKKFYN